VPEPTKKGPPPHAHARTRIHVCVRAPSLHSSFPTHTHTHTRPLPPEHPRASAQGRRGPCPAVLPKPPAAHPQHKQRHRLAPGGRQQWRKSRRACPGRDRQPGGVEQGGWERRGGGACSVGCGSSGPGVCGGEARAVRGRVRWREAVPAAWYGVVWRGGGRRGERGQGGAEACGRGTACLMWWGGVGWRVVRVDVAVPALLRVGSRGLGVGQARRVHTRASLVGSRCLRCRVGPPPPRVELGSGASMSMTGT
jgi:hypothetical protein